MRIDAAFLTREDFAPMFERMRTDPTGAETLASEMLYPVEDAVEEFRLMEERLAELLEEEADGFDEVGRDPAAPEPVENRFRDVGRNDPCPCGSGKKFKKCCLAA